MKRSEIDRNKLAPMMKHYVELKDNYPELDTNRELIKTVILEDCGFSSRTPRCPEKRRPRAPFQS